MKCGHDGQAIATITWPISGDQRRCWKEMGGGERRSKEYQMVDVEYKKGNQSIVIFELKSLFCKKTNSVNGSLLFHVRLSFSSFPDFISGRVSTHKYKLPARDVGAHPPSPRLVGFGAGSCGFKRGSTGWECAGAASRRELSRWSALHHPGSSSRLAGLPSLLLHSTITTRLQDGLLYTLECSSCLWP